MRACVVGATGFVGGAIAVALRDAGWDVRAGRRRSSNTLPARRLRLSLVEADLERPEGLLQAFDGCDLVYFAAGYIPRYDHLGAEAVQTAITQTEALVSAARRVGVRRVVYTGSAATLQRPSGPDALTTEDALDEPAAGSTYHAVKLAIAQTLQQAAAGAVEVVELLPTACLGPGDFRVGTSAPLLALLRGELDAWVDGVVDVIDVRDVAAAHLAAAAPQIPAPSRYLLGGHRLRLSALLERVSHLTGCPAPPAPLAADVARHFAAEAERAAEGTPHRPALNCQLVELTLRGLRVDATRARRDLSLNPRPLDETLRETARWWADQGLLRRRPARPPNPDPPLRGTP